MQWKTLCASSTWNINVNSEKPETKSNSVIFMWFMTARFNNITMLMYSKQPLSFPQWLGSSSGNRLVKSPEVDTNKLLDLDDLQIPIWIWRPLSFLPLECIAALALSFDLDFPLMLVHASILGCSQWQSSSWFTSYSISSAMGPAAHGTREIK